MTRYYWCDDKTKEKIEETSHDESGVTPIILMGASEGQGPVDSCVDISDNTIMFYGEVSERNAKLQIKDLYIRIPTCSFINLLLQCGVSLRTLKMKWKI